MPEDNNGNMEEIHEGYRSEVYLAKRKMDVADGMVIEEIVVSLKSADLDTETMLKMAVEQFEKEETKSDEGLKNVKKEKWRD